MNYKYVPGTQNAAIWTDATVSQQPLAIIGYEARNSQVRAMHKRYFRNSAHDFSIKLSSCMCSHTDSIAVLAVGLCDTLCAMTNMKACESEWFNQRQKIQFATRSFCQKIIIISTYGNDRYLT